MSLRIDRSRPERMKVCFVWPDDEPAGPISVVGTFNEWQPGLDELEPAEDGTRSVTLGLPYGTRYVFRYLAADGQWLDEPDADEMTTSGSVLRPKQCDLAAPQRFDTDHAG